MTGIENTTLYNEDMKGISTDNASFEFFRKNDVLYVDKTEFIYRAFFKTQVYNEKLHEYAECVTLRSQY